MGIRTWPAPPPSRSSMAWGPLRDPAGHAHVGSSGAVSLGATGRSDAGHAGGPTTGNPRRPTTRGQLTNAPVACAWRATRRPGGVCLGLVCGWSPPVVQHVSHRRPPGVFRTPPLTHGDRGNDARRRSRRAAHAPRVEASEASTCVKARAGRRAAPDRCDHGRPGSGFLASYDLTPIGTRDLTLIGTRARSVTGITSMPKTLPCSMTRLHLRCPRPDSNRRHTV